MSSGQIVDPDIFMTAEVISSPESALKNSPSPTWPGNIFVGDNHIPAECGHYHRAEGFFSARPKRRRTLNSVRAQSDYHPAAARRF